MRQFLQIDLDPAYWLNLGRRVALYLAPGLLFGGPVGFLVWRKTGSRWVAIVVGVVAGVVGLLIVGYLYFTIVLCPPDARCA
ncbi:MAG: hypothetical protein ACE5F5_01140 [Acidimicrobiia bacterium]